ncbi:MAG: hypothetical protein JWP13_760 [Candidatus Saccharibacteria bacterium]|nr:hypothetical protein [Candidatus Saccharibacteria bacterium]
MPTWLLSLILAVGVTAWSYNKLARANGNASPQSNFALAALAGAIMFLVIFSLLKLVLGF